MRGESPFTAGERELLFAYVSGLNACDYCFGAHKAIAHAFGVEESLFETMQNDLDSSGVAEKLKPVLAYVAKLTSSPSKVVAADARPVYEAGWDERALHDAVAVCSLANFMNRFVDSTGCSLEAENFGKGAESIIDSYLGWGRVAEFID